MIKLVSVEQMRKIEQQGDAAGVSYAVMMERAGRGMGRIVNRLVRKSGPRCAVGLVGVGNNGGDTLVALTQLAELDWEVRAYLLRPRSAEDENLKRLLQTGAEIDLLDKDPDYAVLDGWLTAADVVLDGVLGTGARLPLRADVAAVLAHVRDFTPRPYIAAVDCPSGVDCDRGEAADSVIPATVTICMDAVKQGLLAFPAFDLVGQIILVPLGLPENLPALTDVDTFVITARDVAAALPQRSRQAHKGSFGTLCVIGGAQEYPGAPGFTAEAAYRIGTGLVRVAIPGEIQGILANRLPEAVWTLLPGEGGGIAASAAATLLPPGLGRTTAVVLGPGMGSQPGTAEFVRRLFNPATQPWPEVPLVVDADGLRHLAKLPDWPRLLPARSILTPHPGEMSALTGLSIADIALDRIGTARRYARLWGQIVILKGAFSVIAHPDGRVAILAAATAALAKAGTGDVLAGLIGGLLAQGVAPFEAALAGAWIHARAGEAAAAEFQQTASVMVRDVLAAIPRVLADLAQDNFLLDQV